MLKGKMSRRTAAWTLSLFWPAPRQPANPGIVPSSLPQSQKHCRHHRHLYLLDPAFKTQVGGALESQEGSWQLIPAADPPQLNACYRPWSFQRTQLEPGSDARKEKGLVPEVATSRQSTPFAGPRTPHGTTIWNPPPLHSHVQLPFPAEKHLAGLALKLSKNSKPSCEWAPRHGGRWRIMLAAKRLQNGTQ